MCTLSFVPAQLCWVLLLSSSIALAGREIRLPELGSKRRVVLSELRQSGLTLIDGSGDRLAFVGGPKGLEEANLTVCHFTNLELDELRLEFPRLDDQRRVSTMNRLQRRLSAQYGQPRPRMAHGGTSTPSATWRINGSQLTLSGQSDGAPLTIVMQAPEPQRWRDAEQVSKAAWAPDHFDTHVTEAKRATQELFYEFGNQGFITWGAQRKGSPVGLRLKNVSIPAAVRGIDREMISLRFLYFTRGHDDVVMAQSRRQADVDVEVRVIPVEGDAGRSFALRLVARAVRGSAQGQVLYSGAQRL